VTSWAKQLRWMCCSRLSVGANRPSPLRTADAELASMYTSNGWRQSPLQDGCEDATLVGLPPCILATFTRRKASGNQPPQRLPAVLKQVPTETRARSLS
jgi:hypothetical protein